LLPHKLSEYGPALAVGDVDGNGMDDIFVSGAKGKPAVFLLQRANGKFMERPLQVFTDPYRKPFEELGSLLLDIDNDKDLDLYICSGSNEFKKQDTAYRDRLFINDGQGNFNEDVGALPQNLASKQVVKSADFDNDGDLDLFIGSRSVPNEYPQKASAYIYRNDTKAGKIKFTDITSSLAPAFANLGMISDAVWSDFDNDGKTDLVVCGEFMAVHFFKNTGAHFEQTASDTDSLIGLWNSITPADIDNDGDIDYIAGNLGLNSFYKGTTQYPFEIYSADFDNNGSYDAIPFVYLKNNTGQKEQYPAFTRDDVIKQLLRVKGQFPRYADFSQATLTEILTEAERKSAYKVSANYMQSVIFQNNGKGKFTILPLPYQAQWSPVYGVLADDFDGDGNIDLLVNTNDLGTEVSTGQYDALKGLYLQGNGAGQFKVATYQESNYYVPSNGKAIVKFIYNKQYALASSQNKAALLLFGLNNKNTYLRLEPDDRFALIYLKNGKLRREEKYYGQSFLSQSAGIIMVNEQIDKIRITNRQGKTREIRYDGSGNRQETTN